MSIITNSIHHSYGTLKNKSEEKEERLNPNAAWRMRRRMKALTNSTYECDVCEGRCDANDIITLDSGDYYVCSDNCADEAAEIF